MLLGALVGRGLKKNSASSICMRFASLAGCGQNETV
jgi:hypothetical protein